MKKLLLLVPALIGLNTGCEEIEPFLPTVTFQRFDVQDIDFEDADVDFVFAVNNPNPVEVSLSSFSYAFGLEGVDLLDGDDADGLTLDAVGSSEMALPVHLTWQDAWDTVQAMRGEDYVDFGLRGNFGFDTPIGEALIPYDEGGDFPALRTPKFSFKKVRVQNIDVFNQTARIEVDLGVANDHASTLLFENFDYDLSLGGRKVATGRMNELGEVLGAEEGEFSIPATVDLLDAGDVVWDALNGRGDLRVGLAATTDVDTPFGILPLAVDESGDVEVVQ